MWGCDRVGGDSAVRPHSMAGVGGEGHTQERARECCTCPLATYPLKKCPKDGAAETGVKSGLKKAHRP